MSSIADGVGLAAVVGGELEDHSPVLTRTHAAVIRAASKTVGVEFIDENGGIGVQLRLTGTWFPGL